MNLLFLTLAYEDPTNQFLGELALWGIGIFIGFLISVYIIRAIFDIPTIVRMHKAQVRLLEQIAKQQGVEEKIISTIITESEAPSTMS